MKLTENSPPGLQAAWTVIVNPAANNGRTGRRWQSLEKQLRPVLSNMSVHISQAPGHAALLAEQAIAAGARHLIAVGGDGTNHEVVNGILRQTTVPPRDIVYALLPVGTGNDWIRTYGIPTRIGDWLAMLATGQTVWQDIGRIAYQGHDTRQERYFVNVAGLAYDAFVVRYSEQHRGWLRNRFFYLLLILRCLFQYRLQCARIETDTTSIEDYFYTINVGICRYSGGGMQLVPQARPNDGLLALTYARRVSKLGVILNTWRFYNGSIGKHPQITTGQARYVHVSGKEPVPLEADGEFLGWTPATFTILEKALRVVVPTTID